jgi:hypothetical protein
MSIPCPSPPPPGRLLELLAHRLLGYPQVSDNSGFGTGGTSTSVTVLQSSDLNCDNPTDGIEMFFRFSSIPWAVSHNVSHFGSIGNKILSTGVFSIRPHSASFFLSQSLTRHTGLSNSMARFLGEISFDISQGPVSTNNKTGTGFDWTVNIRRGTDLYIISGDDRGLGSGGVAPLTVAYSAHSSSLDSTSPSSTAGGHPTSSSNGPSRPSS